MTDAIATITRSGDLQTLARGLKQLAERLERHRNSPLDVCYTEAELAAIRLAAEIVLESRPIPVTECLPSISPDDGQEFQVYARRTRDSDRRWHYAIYDGVTWICSVTNYTLKDATHWLPLIPDPE